MAESELLELGFTRDAIRSSATGELKTSSSGKLTFGASQKKLFKTQATTARVMTAAHRPQDKGQQLRALKAQFPHLNIKVDGDLHSTDGAATADHLMPQTMQHRERIPHRYSRSSVGTSRSSHPSREPRVFVVSFSAQSRVVVKDVWTIALFFRICFRWIRIER